jgi:hypothetical protein
MVRPCLIAKSFFVEVATPMGPYVAWFNHPMWGGAGFPPPLSGGEEPLRWFTLLWRRRFESFGMTAQVMRVEGEEPLGPRLERF